MINITTNIVKLAQKGELYKSNFSEKQIKALLDNGFAKVELRKRNGRNIFVLIASDSLKKYIKDNKSAKTRSELAKRGQSTKNQNMEVMKGIFYKTKEINLPKYALAFSKNPSIQNTSLLIVVENFENLRMIESQQIYKEFSDAVFCWRNNSHSFFQNFKKVIYYGDYDIAGLKIFLSEIKHKNKSLYVPATLDKDIQKSGLGSLFAKQHSFLNYVCSSDRKDVKMVLKSIQEYQKCLEQEFYINA